MPLLADRVRKARKASRLACGCHVRTGHQIARVNGRWVCIGHCLASQEGEPMPEYNAMISREENGPDPLVPEPVSTEKAARPAKPAKKARKSAKAAKKGK